MNNKQSTEESHTRSHTDPAGCHRVSTQRHISSFVLQTWRWLGMLGLLLYGWAGSACSPVSPGTEGSNIESKQEISSQESPNDQNNEATQESTIEPIPEQVQELLQEPIATDTASDASEPTTEQTGSECVLSCGDVRSRCLDKDRVERCIAQTGCAVWKTETCEPGKECKDGDCVVKTCQGPGECGTGFHCKDGRCESNSSCCKVETRECTNNTARSCEKGPDDCGQWSTPQTCPQDQGCHKNVCSVCRHRACQGPADCCPGTSCSYGYCLVHCNTTQGETNNPSCATDEYCFELQPGSQALCFVDFTEPKGASCSIIKMCQFGLSCVQVSTDYRCHTDCNPKQGTAGNPRCANNEQCASAPGTPDGGVCVPFQGQSKKLYESCDANNPCIAPNLCTGQAAGSTYCLAPCNPQQNPSTCPTTDLCAGYDQGDPTKGICVQRCSVVGTKDICNYGLCRSQNNETFCF